MYHTDDMFTEFEVQNLTYINIEIGALTSIIKGEA